MKRIVIVPVFCDTHHIKCQIPNIIETINPDYLVYNEGAFPWGPESGTGEAFKKKYTLDGKRGFDFEELQAVIQDAQKKYSQTNIILNQMDYKHRDAATNYYDGCSNFEQLGIKVEEGDLVYPYEGDVFHLESDKDNLDEAADRLTLDSGFRTTWLDFIGNQYYIQGILSRKICIRYKTEEFYKKAILQFQHQNYQHLVLENINTFHYAWMRPPKYLTMRYEQIVRPANYWGLLDRGLQEIVAAGNKKIEARIRTAPIRNMFDKAIYYDGPSPEAIKNHECYYKNE